MKKHFLVCALAAGAICSILYLAACKKSSMPQNTNSNAISYFSDTSYKIPDIDTTPGTYPFTFTEDMDLSKVPTLGHKTTVPSSDSFNVPPVQDQRPLESCGGWAVGYAFMGASYAQSVENFGSIHEDSWFSPMFVWNQLNGGSNSGIKLGEAMQLLTSQGCCKWEYMPGNNFDFTEAPSYSAILNAENYKLASIHQFKTPNDQLIKEVLNKHYPIVVGIKVDEAFGRGLKISSDFDVQDDGRLVWKRMKSSIIGGHAFVLCGYDDKINAFKFVNSWGDGWGNNGYGWIDYNFLASVVAFNNNGVQMYWGELQKQPNNYFGTQILGSRTLFTARAYNPYSVNLAVADLALSLQLDSAGQHVLFADFSCHGDATGLPSGGIFHDAYVNEKVVSSSVSNGNIILNFTGASFAGNIFKDSVVGTFTDTAKFTDDNSGYVTYPIMLYTPITLHRQ